MSEELQSTLPDLSRSTFKNVAATATQASLYTDLDVCHEGVQHFLNSDFNQTRDLLLPLYGKSLYGTHGVAIIYFFKAVMTAVQNDIDQALTALQSALEMATAHRKSEGLIGLFSNTFFAPNKDAHLRSMNAIEKHAELVFAEGYLFKALLSLVTDTNLVAFVREGLNLRTAHGLLKKLFRFTRHLVDDAIEHGQDPETVLADHGIDVHLLSGIVNGVGAFNMIISMMPQRVLNIFEIMGFSGDRDFALTCLEVNGGWPIQDRSAIAGTSKRKKKKKKLILPNYATRPTGLRKANSDIFLFAYHIVLSSMIPLPDCDIRFGEKITSDFLGKFPNSFLAKAFHARSYQTRGRLDEAVALYSSISLSEGQAEWRNLMHVCLWDKGICYASLGQWDKAYECYLTLIKESKWSPAIYHYMAAVSLYCDKGYVATLEVMQLMNAVPGLTRKISGKSIPWEKFVSRKTRKFAQQNNSLCLPGLELVYLWAGFHSIPEARLGVMLDEIDGKIKDLESQSQANNDTPPYETFYDDVCLARFLKGVILQEMAVPSSGCLIPANELIHATLTPVQSKQLGLAVKQFAFIALHADHISLDHWILPFARYECGQVYLKQLNYEAASREFRAGVEGGYAEDEAGERVKKVSLEVSLHLKVHNVLDKVRVMQALSSASALTDEGHALSANIGVEPDAGVDSDED